MTHASITRCSQPLVGAGKKNADDEAYLSNIYKANNAKKMYIMDARPKINAVANMVSTVGVCVFIYTVEPLLKDPLAKGRCIKYLSTGDSTLVTKIQFLM